MSNKNLNEGQSNQMMRGGQQQGGMQRSRGEDLPGRSWSREGILYDDFGQPSGYYYEEWTVSGPFTGYGPEGYQRTDERIMEEVCDRLSQHGRLDARNIKVDVKNGEVTLSGTVDSRQAKRMAEDTVDSVPGVQDIHNQLHVERRSQGMGDMSQPRT